MGWSIGYDSNWQRDIGYGVPCVCDHPDCNEQIDRGLSYVCGGMPYGGGKGCGLFFCSKHKGHHPVTTDEDGDEDWTELCDRCAAGKDPFDAKPDIKVWIDWKLSDPSWEKWRKENPEFVRKHAGAKEGGGKP